jgi:hypothetical protein
MNNKFDELTKSLAQSLTRRSALKKFGVGLAGMALACFGLPNKAGAVTYQGYCEVSTYGGLLNSYSYTSVCLDINGCVRGSSADCPAAGTPTNSGMKNKVRRACSSEYSPRNCSFTV